MEKELSRQLAATGYTLTGSYWPGWENTAVELVYSSVVVDETGRVWWGEAPIEDPVKEFLSWMLKVSFQETEPIANLSPLVRQLVERGYELQKETTSGLLAGCGKELGSGRAVWDEYGRLWLLQHPSPEEGFPDGVQVIK